MSRQTGFTLVELVAVVCLLSLLLAATAVLVRQPHLGVHRARQVELMLSYDRSARRRAERDGRPYLLRYDLDANTVGLFFGREGRRSVLPLVRPGYGIRIAAVRPVGGRTIRSGRVEIPIDRWGASTTYGLELREAGTRSSRYIVAGVSGKIEQVATEAEMIRVLEELQKYGNDTD